jgi:hypothetical protein
MVCVACHRPAAPPAEGVRIVPFERIVKRDSAGRALPTGSSIDRAGDDGVEAVNARVRVLRVMPERIVARVGDTLTPFNALAIVGFDSAGRALPRVIPLFGPFRQEDVVRPLQEGRWLAVKPGQTRVGVRVARTAQRPSEDTALVRSVLVEVVR